MGKSYARVERSIATLGVSACMAELESFKPLELSQGNSRPRVSPVFPASFVQLLPGHVREKGKKRKKIAHLISLSKDEGEEEIMNFLRHFSALAFIFSGLFHFRKRRKRKKLAKREEETYGNKYPPPPPTRRRRRPRRTEWRKWHRITESTAAKIQKKANGNIKRCRKSKRKT
jgi:hypothetical protein